MTEPASTTNSSYAIPIGSTDLRVAIVGRFPMHPLRFGGGVETSTWHLVEGLVHLGECEVHLVTTSSHLKSPLGFSDEGVEYHYLPAPARFNTVTNYRQIRRRILAALEAIEPHVVHAQDALMHGSICLRSPFPVVVSVHGIVREEARLLGNKRERLRRQAHARLQEATVANARHLIQPTHYPQQVFAARADTEWHEIGNAIGDRFFEVERDPEPGRILYVGAIIRRKRLLDLIEAVARLIAAGRPVRLRVAGPEVEPDYAEEVKTSIATHGIENHIDFLGLVSQTELVSEYARCHMAVLPSGQETSPVMIVEAMAASVPVIATEVGGVAELIRHGSTGLLFSVGDLDALIAAIDDVVSAPATAVAMGNAAREDALKRFRSAAVAARAIEVYRAAIIEHGVGA